MFVYICLLYISIYFVFFLVLFFLYFKKYCTFAFAIMNDDYVSFASIWRVENFHLPSMFCNRGLYVKNVVLK